jgi:hypothetical protein
MNAAMRRKTLGERSTSYGSRILSFGAFLLVMASHAAAQGCAMCYQNAASSGAQGREALRHGILILLVPALSLFIGIFSLIYRRRNPASANVPGSANSNSACLMNSSEG